MSNINKQALRGQSVEGSYYLAECGHCGEMYPSNKLDGGESLFSGDYGECFCHLCGADDSDIADNGAWGSEAVTAWNYQQKRIEALLDELEKMQAQSSKWCEAFHKAVSVGARYEERIAELEVLAFNPALLDVISERQRQRAVEGWTSEHDDAYQNSELADAAACYAINAHNQGLSTPAHWPWAPDWWKQSGPRRDLVKAGALILAEIERIDRAAAGKGETS
ncbi:TPA: hypothetical protein ACQ80C_001328 [Escherichia coli]